jgi:hypothetical protein
MKCLCGFDDKEEKKKETWNRKEFDRLYTRVEQVVDFHREITDVPLFVCPKCGTVRGEYPNDFDPSD